MAATQRFVMVVDPAERAAWGERAQRAGLTVAEFLRQAANVYDPDDLVHARELRALMPELRGAAADIRARLGEARERLDYALDPARDEEARARAVESITPAEVDAMAELLA